MWVACFSMPLFSIACERRTHPDLADVPLGLHDEKGILCAVSPEARAAGVQVGQTPASARIFCPGLQVRPYHTEVYRRMAEPVWDRIACDSSHVEPLSVEICLAAFQGAGIRERVRDVREDIRRMTNIPVASGVSRSRFTAQMAALSSVDEETVVEEGKEAAFLANCPAFRLPDLSRDEEERLHRLGLVSLGDIAALPEAELYRVFRERSFQLRRWALGQDRDPVRALWPPDFEEHTVCLDDSITDEAMLHEAIDRCARGVSQALQQRGARCRSTALILRSETGKAYVRTELLHMPEADADTLTRTGQRLLGRMMPSLEDPPISVTLRARIAERCADAQAVLFDEQCMARAFPHEEQTRLKAAVDFVCERFGQWTVVKASDIRSDEAFRLWTYPLGRRLNERIEVRTNSEGIPTGYRRGDQWWEVQAVRNRWSEAEWQQGRMGEGMVFRVETSSLALAELRQFDGEWRLTAIAD